MSKLTLSKTVRVPQNWHQYVRNKLKNKTRTIALRPLNPVVLTLMKLREIFSMNMDKQILHEAKQSLDNPVHKIKHLFDSLSLLQQTAEV